MSLGRSNKKNLSTPSLTSNCLIQIPGSKILSLLENITISQSRHTSKQCSRQKQNKKATFLKKSYHRHWCRKPGGRTPWAPRRVVRRGEPQRCWRARRCGRAPAAHPPRRRARSRRSARRAPAAGTAGRRRDRAWNRVTAPWPRRRTRPQRRRAPSRGRCRPPSTPSQAPLADSDHVPRCGMLPSLWGWDSWSGGGRDPVSRCLWIQHKAARVIISIRRAVRSRLFAWLGGVTDLRWSQNELGRKGRQPTHTKLILKAL